MKLGRKRDVNYFALLSEMADCACSAADLLDGMLRDYTNIVDRAEAVHAVEHKGDRLLHSLLQELNRAFITPVDREDLMAIGNGIDTITDSIEDVANLFAMLSIQRVEPEVLPMSSVMLSACSALAGAVAEFERFRSSKKLAGLIIEVNQQEEKGDALHRATVKALYNRKDLSVLDIVKWKEIYDDMERIFDACEDVADLLESITVKNR